MNKRPTIHAVAREAGVSVSTVSQVLREVGRISEETRRKVQQAASKLDYVRDRRAMAMRSGESRDVGLLIHRIANPFNAEVVSGVSSHLQDMGYLLFILDAEDNAQLQEKYLRTLIGGHAGGLLWIPATGTPGATIDWVRRNSPATVTWLRTLPDHPFDHIGVDSTHGTALATRHLVELGHRKIAFLGGNQASPTINDRISGYAGVIATAGLNAPIIRPCVETKTDAKAAAIELCTECPDVTGIVCNCDVVAAGATLGLAQLGQRVGRDVSVVGFDDIEDSRLWEPPLTSVAVDPKGIGQQIAEAFIARKTNPDAPVRTINLPVRLMARASSGPPTKGNGTDGQGNPG